MENNSLVTEDNKLLFQKLILKWARNNLINYPWREKRTPYKVLISEILLTRTKAKQVAPIFIEFIKKYPCIETFIESKIKDLQNLISSLGLLYRAQKLENLKTQLKSDFDNRIPDNLVELKSLSGIGDYAANAILCFGFEIRRPILDSNFIRIYRRVFEVNPKTKTAKTDKFLWQFAEDLLPEIDYVTFNYGVLDIGGNFCLSRNPKCKECPVNKICLFFEKNVKI